MAKLVTAGLIASLVAVSGDCPFKHTGEEMPAGHFSGVSMDAAKEYAEAAKRVDFDAVKADIVNMLTDSQDFWPADFGNYGPFFIRQAWHCAGSYRSSDGVGGCDGGRQRFEPERSWDDNTNLDKAKSLLWPIKEKYGRGLSWGDLIILAGTTSIESMGGPVLGFCAGRIDDVDGSASVNLGPTPEQEKNAPCAVNGQCEKPLGTTTVGLIYLNPEGPMGEPLPAESALEVRDAFGRMSMNDTETVALIGGGHAFGKTHGACPAGPGPKPFEDPTNPWPGACGSGKGNDTFTSGFEGAWTHTPTQWGNSYFTRLLNNEFEVYKGPGGHWQWRGINEDPADNMMMLTSDVSLLNDDTYLDLVNQFANDPAYFDDAFSHAWYKLVTRDMGPVSRCLGKDVAPPQPFQFPLPDPPAVMADFDAVGDAVLKIMHSSSDIIAPDTDSVGDPYYGALFTQLAWQCATTFRQTDYQGGCNGARIRFSPQSDWEVNVAMDEALALLQPVKDQFGDKLSWADLIVFAGQLAVQEASGIPMNFCPGRTDAADGAGSQYLSPNLDLSAGSEELRASATLLGLSDREMVALSGRMRSAQQQSQAGYEGSWTDEASNLSNDYFTTLLDNAWTKYTTASGKEQYALADGSGSALMTPADLALRFDDEYLAIAQDFAASDNKLFLKQFSRAWTKLMNADRFDGPAGNVCE